MSGLKNKILTVAVLFAAFIGSAVFADNDFSPGKAKITASTLNVRNIASQGGVVVSTVKRGDIVSAIQKSPNQASIDDLYDYWYKIATADGKKGWVFGGYITFELNLERGLRWKSVNPGSGEYFTDVVASGNNVIAGTKSGVLYSTRDGGKTWKKVVPQALGNRVGAIYKLVQDGKNLWLLSSGSGLWKTTNNGASWSQYTSAQGLPSNNITGIFFDKGKKIWAATEGGLAVSENGGSSWTSVEGTDKLEGGKIYSVAVVGGEVLAGTEKGIYAEKEKSSMFGGSKKSWQAVNSSQAFKISDIVIAKDTLFAGSSQGLLRGTPGKTGDWITIGGKSLVRYIIVDPKNRIIVGTSNGLNISLDNGDSWVTYKREDGLASNDVNGIAVDEKNTIWISMGKGGIAYHD